MRSRKRLLGVVALAGLLWLALVYGQAVAREPFCDEAWYSLPAWNLATNGSMGAPVIEPSDSHMPAMPINLQGVERHAFFEMPLPTAVQAIWYRIAGFSLLQLRLFSAFWTAVLLFAWYSIVTRVSDNPRLGAFAAAFIAMDSFMFSRTPFGRMDMMAAACASAAIAVYLALRERDLGRALFAGEALVVLSALTHPNGGMVGFVMLAAVIVWLDRDRLLSWRNAGAFLLPYALGAAVMTAFVLPDPAAFRAQFFSSSVGRLDSFLHPLRGVVREFGRYAIPFGLGNDGGLQRTKAVFLAIYAISLGVVCCTPALRRRFALLPILCVSGFLALSVVENLKVGHYLVYVLPPLVAMTAVVSWELDPKRRLATAVAVVVIGSQALADARLIQQDPYHAKFVPAVQWIRNNAAPNAVVMADSIFFFELGTDRLVDDFRLGFKSGKRADIVVVNDRYLDFFAYLKTREPATWRHIQSLLSDGYSAVPVNPSYTIYVRKPAAPAGA